MKATHRLFVTALCPVNGAVDIYEATVETNDFLQVEDILAAAHAFADRKIFQESLTREMAEQLPHCTVRTVGYHSGVKTEVVA